NRTVRQPLFEIQDDQHRAPEAGSVSAALRRIPDAALRIRVPGGHLRRASTLRRELSERPHGSADDGCVSGIGRCHPQGIEGAPREPVGVEHHAEYIAALSGPSLWTWDPVWRR